MERIAYKKLDVLTDSGTDNGNGAGVDILDFVLPAGFVRWTAHVVPKDSGSSPDAPTLEVQYGIGSEFYPLNPASSGTLDVNKDNTITRSEQVSKVRFKITNGATPPDEGLEVEIYGARESAG